MDAITQTHLNNLWSTDRERQNQAFFYILAATDQPVDWAYTAWETLVANLRHKDNHNRAIAAQILCNLAKSDPDRRILHDFPALLTVTKDERFVTARHCMQALWKVGVAGSEQCHLWLEGVTTRFHECISEKNCTLIRYDILQSMRKVYDYNKDDNKDDNIKARALVLIETETDLKYRKKYATLWKKT